MCPMTADFEWSARSRIGLDTLDLTGSRIIAVDDGAPLAGVREPATLVSARSSSPAIDSPFEEQPASLRASRPRPRVAAVAGLCALSALRRSMDRLGDGLAAETRRLAVWPDTPGEAAVAVRTPSGAGEATLMMNRSRKLASETDEAPKRAPMDGGSRRLTPADVEPQGQILSPGSARLNLNAIPWADVWVDGVYVGQTPLGNVRLRAGRHRVRFSHPELGERAVVASVRRGQVAHVAVDFGEPDRR